MERVELPLFPSSAQSCSTPTGTGSGSPQEQHQQLTIFYNGRICVADVTELRARAIIMAAYGGMDKERMKKSLQALASMESHQLRSPSGVSMKRSLHQFLQKRKHRREAVSPYNH